MHPPRGSTKHHPAPSTSSRMDPARPRGLLYCRMMPAVVMAAVQGLDQHGSGIAQSLPLRRVGVWGSPILTPPCSVYGSGAAPASAHAGGLPSPCQGWLASGRDAARGGFGVCRGRAGPAPNFQGEKVAPSPAPAPDKCSTPGAGDASPGRDVPTLQLPPPLSIQKRSGGV